MKKDELINALEEGLSVYLLRESDKFPVAYPIKRRRTKGNLALQKVMDDELRKWTEWRMTFAPQPAQGFKKWYNSAPFLNRFYCRDVLRQVPEIVERHQKLSQLILSEIGDRESFVYLSEAAKCYILGLPQAAIALSRAAVEAKLRNAVSKFLGSKTVRGAGLKEIINNFASRGRLLSTKGRELANKVRVAGDDVLHVTPSDSGSALAVIEAARAVILELEEKKGRS